MKSKSSGGLSYYFREGLTSIFKHGFMSFASMFTIIACLLIMGTFALLAVNVSDLIKKFENSNLMIAYIDDSVDETTAANLAAQFYAASDNVLKVEFVSREEAMIDYLGPDYENDERFKGIVATDFRNRYHIYVYDVAQMSKTQNAVVNVPGVAKVTANLEIAEGLVTVRNIVSGVSLILIAILLLISLLIISNTIKLTTVERREEIAVMRMVGATSRFIRWPFIFQGFIIGIIGALIAFVIEWLLYRYAVVFMRTITNSALLSVIPFSTVASPMFVGFVAIGFLVGVFGSMFAIRKYLKV